MDALTATNKKRNLEVRGLRWSRLGFLGLIGTPIAILLFLLNAIGTGFAAAIPSLTFVALFMSRRQYKAASAIQPFKWAP